MTETKTTEYLVTYTVPATSRLHALMSAGQMLRKTVRVVGEAETHQVNPVWWEVTFLLAEDYEVSDPIHETHSDDPSEGPSRSECPTCMAAFTDHPAEATVETEYARP